MVKFNAPNKKNWLTTAAQQGLILQ